MSPSGVVSAVERRARWLPASLGRWLVSLGLACAALACAALATGSLAGQDPAAQDPVVRDLAALEERVGEGRLRFHFEAREGICGGRPGNIRVRGEGEARVAIRDGACDCACEEGPVRVELRLADGRPADLDLRIGGAWPERGGRVEEAGEVPPELAADYLLGLARRAPPSVGKRATFAATLARGVEPWPGLLELAREDAVPRETRRAAVFWLGQAAAREATRGLVSVIESEEELEVREHAVFALSRRDDEEAVRALIRLARAHEEPEIRRKALFWLGQRADDPRVLALFEEILLGS